MSEVNVVAVIPARMASSRFPGKPLLRVRGLPMVEHVRRRALLCGKFSEVVVATCDAEIADVVEAYGGRVVMTSPHHPAATDRIAEASSSVACTHVVNVQGDEILVLPQDLRRLVQAIESDPQAEAWNAVASIEHPDELGDPSIVKCVVSRSHRILFCARDFSHLRGRMNATPEPLRKLLGILAYRKAFLERYPQLPRTPLEEAEAVDQSRIIEYDVTLRAVEFQRGYPGINEPREVAVVESFLERDSLQREALDEIMGLVAF